MRFSSAFNSFFVSLKSRCLTKTRAVMKEEFLHYLWKYSLYDSDKLIDDNGNRIIVINPGEYNRDSGPDFFNARLLIGDMEWAGNVEIHIRSSHYNVHGHNHDPAFDNIILHVVAENDKRVYNTRGEEILTVELVYSDLIYDRYVSLVNNPFVVACESDLPAVDGYYIRHWLSALVIERLQEKTEQVMKIFSETGNDWDETFYRMLTRYFGFRVNSEPFAMLAAALPFKIIRKHSDNRLQVEALLFGTAGMLEEGLFKDAIKDTYYVDLIREYKVLSSKYSLQPIDGWIWKFSRLRPANFPTVRIAQLATMLTVAGGLFSKVLEAVNINELMELLEVSASDYWNDHFIFGKISRSYPKVTGLQAANILIINAVVPLLFANGRYRDSEMICERAVRYLEETNPEQNSIIDGWESAGISAESAFYTQALIHLRNNYCRKRRCLECRIGAKVISLGKTLKNPDELILEP